MKKLTAFFTAIIVAVTLTSCSKPQVASEIVKAADGHTVFNGNGYAFSYDPKLWNTKENALDGAGDVAAEMGVDVSEEDMQAMTGGIFFYTPDEYVNFNIVANDGGTNGKKVDYPKVADQLKSQYAAINGVDYQGYEIIEINGYEYIKINIMMDMSGYGVTMKMTQYAHFTHDRNYVITLTAVEESYNAAIGDFETVLATFVYDDK